MSDIILSEAEIHAITGYDRATKQLEVLHRRGFTRAFINRAGEVVLERTHYEAVTRGEVVTAGQEPKRRGANLAFLRSAS